MRALILLVTLSSSLTPIVAWAGEPDLAKLFPGRDACFELYDLHADQLVVRSGGRRCAERVSPCSTFKVPLALMAFDRGVLQDERSSLKWDGTHHAREAWNHDQTAASWMGNSVVWFSQRLTPLLGLDAVRAYLAKFDYGNRDMSGGLTTAWLDSTLTISPDEQLTFWERLWRAQLPVSMHATAMTKAITLVETSPAGWTLHGKTGTGDVPPRRAGEKGERQHGWFVGHVARGVREYIVVTSFTDVVPHPGSDPAGPAAREITKRILREMSLY